jgi:hypothetical protein
MIGLWDGSCPVCGGHTYGGITEDGKHTPWTCKQCGATEETPRFDADQPLNWRVYCYEKDCDDVKTGRCFECKDQNKMDIEMPWSIIVNGEQVNVADVCASGKTYADLTNGGKDKVQVVYMDYTAESRIIYDGAEWRITSCYN